MFILVSKVITVTVEQFWKLWIRFHFALYITPPPPHTNHLIMPRVFSFCLDHFACSCNKRVFLAGGHVIRCMWADGGRGCHLWFPWVNVYSEGARETDWGVRGGLNAGGMCLRLCMEFSHMCECDWVIGGLFPSTAASPEISRVERENSVLFSGSGCSFLPGQPHSPLNAKHTPLYPPLTF